MVLALKIGDRVIGEIKKQRGDNVPIGTMYSVNPPHSYPHSFIKGGSSTYAKLIEMGRGSEKFY